MTPPPNPLGRSYHTPVLVYSKYSTQGETDMPKNSGSLEKWGHGHQQQNNSENAKAERNRKWVGYVATIVLHLCDQGVGQTVAVAIAESYSYTKAKQFAQRIKRGEA